MECHFLIKLLFSHNGLWPYYNYIKGDVMCVVVSPLIMEGEAVVMCGEAMFSVGENTQERRRNLLLSFSPL